MEIQTSDLGYHSTSCLERGVTVHYMIRAGFPRELENLEKSWPVFPSNYKTHGNEKKVTFPGKLLLHFLFPRIKNHLNYLSDLSKMNNIAIWKD